MSKSIFKVEYIDEKLFTNLSKKELIYFIDRLIKLIPVENWDLNVVLHNIFKEKAQAFENALDGEKKHID